MWRKTLLSTAILFAAQSVQAQVPSSLPFDSGNPTVPAFSNPALPHSMNSVPSMTPPAPITTAPTGPNPGLNTPGFSPTAPAPIETTTAFNGEQAELTWRDGRHQLVAGNAFLKDFGRSDAEGREVLRVVRELHLNTRVTIGSPQPIMEYWLCNGVAPHGNVAGLHILPIDASALRAEQVQGQWCVHDGSRVLFNFGFQGDACRQALDVIQRYNFTQIGYVGQAAPTMLVFLANPPAIPIKPVVAASRNGLPDMHAPNGIGNTNPAQNAQPNQMPQVQSQPINPLTGQPLHQPGGLTPAGFRLPGTEAADRVAIDPNALQVRHDANDWKLVMGNHVVASFGPNQADAQLAAAALRYYGVTDQVFVGNPHPMFSYFLSHGQAPHGTSYGLNATTFRPNALQVRQTGTTYVLTDGNQVLMSFGDRGTEAQQTLQAIQQYKFDRMSFIGRGDQSMMLFLRTN
jgi:hypothetical protein